MQSYTVYILINEALLTAQIIANVKGYYIFYFSRSNHRPTVLNNTVISLQIYTCNIINICLLNLVSFTATTASQKKKNVTIYSHWHALKGVFESIVK